MDTPSTSSELLERIGEIYSRSTLELLIKFPPPGYGLRNSFALQKKFSQITFDEELLKRVEDCEIGSFVTGFKVLLEYVKIQGVLEMKVKLSNKKFTIKEVIIKKDIRRPYFCSEHKDCDSLFSTKELCEHAEKPTTKFCQTRFCDGNIPMDALEGINLMRNSSPSLWDIGIKIIAKYSC